MLQHPTRVSVNVPTTAPVLNSPASNACAARSGLIQRTARAAAVVGAVAALLAFNSVAAQGLPTVEAEFVPKTLNMDAAGQPATVVLRATTGDLRNCAVSDVHIGNVAAVDVKPSAGGRTYVATFDKQSLSALPAFDSVNTAITGALSCDGVTTDLVTHASVTVLKKTTVEARVKPVIHVGNNAFKHLNNDGKLDVYEDWRLPVEQRVEDLLSRMTLQEKAGLMQITSFREANNLDYIQNRQIHYLILRGGFATAGAAATSLNDWQAIAEGTRLGIPLVITSNPLNNLGGGNAVFEPGGGTGLFSVWPGQLGLAATNNPQLIRDFAEIARSEWRATGIRKMYGYQVDLATEPRWTRNRTTFGEGPQLSASIARNLVLGFQGQRLGPDSVAQTIKHFPGDGAVRNGLDPHNAAGQYSVYPTAGSLLGYQIAPFQAAVDAGTSGIMSYYNRPNNSLSGPQLPADWWQSPTQQFEEVGAAFNQTLITTLLRDYMGFTGYVNTDSGVLTNTGWGVESLSIPQRFAKGVKAGASIFSDNNDPSGLLAAVNQGLLTEAELDPSVRLLLTEMFKLGLFENPYVDPTQAQALAKNASYQKVADQAHREALVLLRNDQNLLPFTSHVNLYVEVFTSGNGAAAQTASLKALFANDPMVRIVDDLAQATAALLYLQPSQVELADRIDIKLSPSTGIDVAKVQQIEAAVPTVLAINFSTAWVINDVEPGAAAVIGTFDVKANALIELLRGSFAPKGKLPISIPASEAAVDANASDVPGYLEAFDYSYRNAVNDTYIFGFGKSTF
jgi:beta-glucosidase